MVARVLAALVSLLLLATPPPAGAGRVRSKGNDRRGMGGKGAAASPQTQEQDDAASPAAIGGPSPAGLAVPSARAAASECRRYRTVVLMVGHSQPKAFALHAEHARRSVVAPLRADVFAVFDASPLPGADGTPMHEAVPRAFGRHLKGMGLVTGAWKGGTHHSRDGNLADRFDEGGAEGVARDLRRRYPSVEVRVLGSGEDGLFGRFAHAHRQWYKLREAWRLMEAHEKALGLQYDLVVKLRFDMTPVPEWSPCAATNALALGAPLAVHAATDMAFWGRREAMAVAATLWEGFGAYFREQPPLGRPLHIDAEIGSFANMPPEAFDREKWDLYNKIGTIAYPDMGKGGDGVEHMVRNLREARRRGYTRVGGADGDQGVGVAGRAPVEQRPGALAAANLDYLEGEFITEKDWLAWMVGHNVTVCDLGARTTGVWYKGEHRARPSKPCRV